MKRLEAAGVFRAQAEAHAEALRDEVAPQLATKPDIDAAVEKINARMEAMMLRHTVAIIAAGSFLVRFLR